MVWVALFLVTHLYYLLVNYGGSWDLRAWNVQRPKSSLICKPCDLDWNFHMPFQHNYLCVAISRVNDFSRIHFHISFKLRDERQAPCLHQPWAVIEHNLPPDTHPLRVSECLRVPDPGRQLQSNEGSESRRSSPQPDSNSLEAKRKRWKDAETKQGHCAVGVHRQRHQVTKQWGDAPLS